MYKIAVQNENNMHERLKVWSCRQNKPTAVQDNLLARAIIGNFICEKQLADFILAIRATSYFLSSFCLELWL